MDHGTCCVSGSVATGTPTGKLESMSCGTVYVATPDNDSTPKTAVVIATDVFGLSPNAKGPYTYDVHNFFGIFEPPPSLYALGN